MKEQIIYKVFKFEDGSYHIYERRKKFFGLISYWQYDTSVLNAEELERRRQKYTIDKVIYWKGPVK